MRRWPAPRASPIIQNVSHVAEILAYFLMARIFNPPHPGLTLKEDVLPALQARVQAVLTANPKETP